MVDQYLMSVAAPKAIAPVIDLTLAQQVICPSVPHQSERLEPAQALSLDVDKASRFRCLPSRYEPWLKNVGQVPEHSGVE